MVGTYNLLLIFIYCSCTTAKPVPNSCNPGCDNCFSSSGIDLKCGSDGATYLNACELDCHRVHCNATLGILHDGICKSIHYPAETVNQDPTLNLTTHEPVTKPTIEPTSTSICDPFQNCTCNYELFLTCGTDRVTYANECVLNCAKKCKKDLQVLHFGSCY